MPRITVAMPAHNAAPYINEAVDSILGQTCRDFELLVVDDGSTDDTARRVEAYADKRLRLIRLKSNQGRAAARNAALDEARGAYLAWMDADDMAMPRRLEKQAAFLDARPDVDVCGGWLQYFHQSTLLERFPAAPEEVRAATVFGASVVNGCSMLRLEVLRDHGLRFDPALERAEDFAFWADLLLGARRRAANLPEVLLRYRYFRRPFVPQWHVRALLGHVFPCLGLSRPQKGRAGAGPAEAALHAGLIYAPLKAHCVRHGAPALLNWLDRLWRGYSEMFGAEPAFQRYILFFAGKILSLAPDREEAAAVFRALDIAGLARN
ncbi:glycosyltransferase family A protein [uncultured Desulfovibrio sp.]|uniref:glycosyltransferase family 2 protein n=1 Tax=uncultured Desulfovibrio sp. TaxID=167968 RepID=UPI00260DF456|nr:glycosyltransferase family A protein [uncultured Desulfovibrio sp.]